MDRMRLVVCALALLAGTESEKFGIALPILASAYVVALCLPRLSGQVRACALAALALGALNARLHVQEASFPPRSVSLRGVVYERSLGEDALRSRFVLLANGARLEVEANGEAPSVGSSVTLRGRLEPFDEARNPGEASPRELAEERGLGARIVHARIRRVEPPDPYDPRLWLPLARAWASDRVRARIEEPYASILAGALWGERGALPPDLRSEFQDTGTVHILVTAGLHVGVVAAAAVALLSWCGVRRVEASLIGIGVVWLYAAFSGAHLPSLRAATMMSFCLLARAAGREALSWNALAAAAIVVALARPQSIGSLSFALSFSCVAAILLFASPLVLALERMRVPHAVAEAVALTIATQIGTWPLTAAGFLLFAPYAPLANALIVPMMGVTMLLGMGMLLAEPIAPLAQGLANLDASLLIWIVSVVRTIGALPHAHVIIAPPAPWAIVLYDAALLWAARLLSLGRMGAAAAIFSCACALVLQHPSASRNELVVTAIDVGQADALLVQTPHGHAFLVDAGGRLEREAAPGEASPAQAVGEKVVVPFLIRAGIRHLDGILLSHPHGDHAGGVAPVLRTLGADFFADSGQRYPGYAYRDALAAARERGAALLEPRGGDVWSTDDGVRLRFYGPVEPYLYHTYSDINNNSLVFRLEYGRFSMLFTGDAGEAAEERMLSSGDDLQADVLKVGHHGSAYSSSRAFLRAVHPSVAIVSVGRYNLFGHPSERTLSALRAVGARVYRTDQDGAIIVRSDGVGESVEAFLRR